MDPYGESMRSHAVLARQLISLVNSMLLLHIQAVVSKL
jgi:hypothetical protein